jgi:hypothetical protein
MAQPERARIAGGPSLEITITYNPSTGEWKADPPDPSKGASVENKGQVTFHAPQGSCLVYTSPADAFVNEPANGCEPLQQGDNNIFTLAPGVNDTEVLYCVCGPSETCTPDKTKDTGGYSIKVGDPPEGGKQ